MDSQNPVVMFCNRVFYCLQIILLLSFSSCVFSSNITPFTTRDQNPLVSIYGLPLPVSARLLQPQQTRWHISTNFSNTINSEQTANELLFVDIETHNVNIIFDTAIQKDWMFRLQLPLIKHYGGFMDKWINDYHDLLKLPEGVRPLHPVDQLSVHYELNGSTLLDIQQSQSGLGDISLQLAYQSTRNNDFSLSYWSSLKLPTGDSRKLTGSDSTDIAFWLACDKKLQNSLWAYSNLGILFMTDSDVMSDIHKNKALFLTAGLQFQASQDIQLKLQFDNHSAFYDTTIDFLGPVIQLTFGGSIILDTQSELDIAIAEDIQTSASPDVNFNLTWRSRF